MRALALEQQKLGGLMTKHFEECGDLQKVTAARLEEGARTMGELKEAVGVLTDSVSTIEARFETFDSVMTFLKRIVDFLAKYGRRVIISAFTAFVGAWASIILSSCFLHASTDHKADVAAVAATNAATTAQDSQKIVVGELKAIRKQQTNDAAPAP
jgi:hypothetical protein